VSATLPLPRTRQIPREEGGDENRRPQDLVERRFGRHRRGARGSVGQHPLVQSTVPRPADGSIEGQAEQTHSQGSRDIVVRSLAITRTRIGTRIVNVGRGSLEWSSVQ
jgi:hypothetical protein